MRAKTIPNFAIGAVIYPEIKASSLEEAQRDLDAHQAQCPGDYRPKEACDSSHNEAWRKWAIRKNDLTTAVNVAFSVKPMPAVVTTKAPQKPKNYRTEPKTPAYYAEMMKLRIEVMAGMVVNSKDWQRARHAAQNYRLKCQNRAKACGVPVPELPSIPGIPIALQVSTGRKIQHDNPRSVADRVRKKAAYDAKKVVA